MNGLNYVQLSKLPEMQGRLDGLFPLLFEIFEQVKEIQDGWERDIYGEGSRAASAREEWHRWVTNWAKRWDQLTPQLRLALCRCATAQPASFVADAVHYALLHKHRQYGYSRFGTYTGD